ncbi:sensor histidine kinase [Alteromonas macleodii str. 'Balearic Sea AD45']|uniref:sensor histidine kinase n=1 Tax=Alteromonas macleodii TaxID=28108 RepID=UPI000286D06D|nr:ATP-binding protein [Alteromonas macleodii]AFT94863.1 sensor histidine kinase [Alteromonas macleodii str. 'Balearic Sea AD45']
MNKLIIHIVLTVTLSLFAFGWLIDEFVYHSTSQNNEQSISENVLLDGFINLLNEVPNEQLKSTVAKLSQQFDTDLVLVSIDDFAFDKDIFIKLETTSIQLASENELFQLKRLANHPDYLLKLTVTNSVEQGRELELFLTLLLYFGVSIAVVLWMSPLIQRLKKLTHFANEFGKGNLSVRVKPAKYSQINVLENSFNKMASQIEHLIEENRLLANSLSHDLRTPVACFRFALDASISESDIDKKNGYLRRMEQDVDNIEGMLNAFLDYASMERKGMQLELRATDVHDFLEAIVNDLKPIAKNKGITLRLNSVISDKHSTFDNSWMYRVYVNLITNAISYAKSDVTVNLFNSVEQISGHKKINCIICDDGPGIPEQDLKKVFEAFVRLDSSRKRNGENFGLGLAIVQRVVDWHGFQIGFLSKGDLELELSEVAQNCELERLGAVVKLTMPVNAKPN